MKERPILFSGEMVRAILEDRKTNTRRCDELLDVIEGGQPPPMLEWFGKRFGFIGRLPDGSTVFSPCRYGGPGDRLWVRETFFIDHYEFYPDGPLPKERPAVVYDSHLLYRADGSCCEQLGECQCEGKGARWRPSIYMPRWASRITLEILSVRVERLRDISEADALAEGIDDGWLVRNKLSNDRLLGFQFLWDGINGEKHPWASNPWVWVIKFRRLP